MRHNHRKTLPEFPVPDRLVQDDTWEAFKEIVLTANKDRINSDIYKGKYKEGGTNFYTVRERLVEIYYKKCAYCEDIDTKPEVEHYRPKKGVTEDKNHPGYYWLCYEWTNLVPSCHYCNTDGGKGNQFPVIGPRVMSPTIAGGVWNTSHIHAASSPLIDERPYLLHPEIDHPDDGSFFRFKNNGEIEGIDQAGRGAKTIQICNLNRQNLLLRRQGIIDAIIENLRKMLKLQFDGRLKNDEDFEAALNLVFEELVEWQALERQFSLLAIYIYNHFDEIIVPLISTPTQGRAVSAAFATFKANSPV